MDKNPSGHLLLFVDFGFDHFVVSANEVVEIFGDVVLVIELNADDECIACVEFLFSVVVHSAVMLVRTCDGGDDGAVRPENIAGGLADDECVFGNLAFEANDATLDALVLCFFHTLENEIVKCFSVEEVGDQVYRKYHDGNVEYAGVLRCGFNEEDCGCQGSAHGAAHEGTHGDEHHGSEIFLGHTDGNEEVCAERTNESADCKCGNEDTARSTACRCEEHHYRAPCQKQKDHVKCFFAAQHTDNDAATAEECFGEEDADDTGEYEDEDKSCVRVELGAVCFHEFLGAEYGNIKNVDGDGYDQTEKEDIADLGEMKLHDSAYVKKNGVDLKNFTEEIVDTRCGKRRRRGNEKERRGNASVNLFENEKNGGKWRTGCHGKARASAACHDLSVGCLTALLGIETVSHGRTDQNAGAFTAERNAAEKAHKASEECAEEGGEPAQDQNAAQDAFASGNTAALDLGKFLVEKIHGGGDEDKTCKNQYDLKRIALRTLVHMMRDLFELFRNQLEKEDRDAHHDTGYDAVADEGNGVRQIFFVFIVFSVLHTMPP